MATQADAADNQPTRSVARGLAAPGGCGTEPAGRPAGSAGGGYPAPSSSLE
jgi:hypothetical protein